MRRIGIILPSLILFVCLILLAGCVMQKPIQGPQWQKNNPFLYETTKLSQSYANIFLSGSYYFRYTSDMNIAGDTTKMEGTVARTEEATCWISKNKVGTTVIESKVLLKDGVLYDVNDTERTYSPLEVMPDSELGFSMDYSQLYYLGKGQEILDGYDRYYEEYQIADGKAKFYFEGQRLYAMKLYPDEGKANSVLLVLELTSEIPPGMLDIPDGYIEVQ